MQGQAPQIPEVGVSSGTDSISLMKLSLSLLVTTLGLSLSIFPSTAAEDFDVQKAAKEIDKLILAGLEKHGVEPNEAIDDETFVRRVYHDVI